MVGFKVQEVRYDGSTMYLVGDEHSFELEPEGDCCAHCYINGLNYIEALQGGTIKEVENLELPDEKNEDYEVINAWGHRFHTDKGIATLDMRVSHNGYYGGWVNVRKVDLEKARQFAILTKDID